MNWDDLLSGFRTWYRWDRHNGNNDVAFRGPTPMSKHRRTPKLPTSVRRVQEARAKRARKQAQHSRKMNWR